MNILIMADTVVNRAGTPARGAIKATTQIGRRHKITWCLTEGLTWARLKSVQGLTTYYDNTRIFDPPGDPDLRQPDPRDTSPYIVVATTQQELLRAKWEDGFKILYDPRNENPATTLPTARTWAEVLRIIQTA